MAADMAELCEVPELWVRADKVVVPFREAEWRAVPAEIRVRGTHIQAVHALDRTRPAPPGTRVVELGDRLVAPAFVNGHTHLPMAGFRGLTQTRHLDRNLIETLFFRLEAGLDGATVRAFTRLGAYECLLSGTATVFEHYYGGIALAEGIAEVGLSALVAPTLQDVAGPGCQSIEGQLDATLAIEENADFAQKGILAALGPHATDTVSDRLWMRIRELSSSRRLPLHTHVAQSLQEYQRSQAEHGCSPLERLERLGVLSLSAPHLMVHALLATERDLRLLDPARHLLALCPQSESWYAFVPDPLGWTEAGLDWLIGTDCAPSNDGMNVQKELRLVAGLPGILLGAEAEYRRFRAHPTSEGVRLLGQARAHAVSRAARLLDPAWLLSRVWSVPNRLAPRLGLGEIRPGARAHLVVYDPGHPSVWPCADPLRALAFSDATPAIEWMMLNGQFLGERGFFQQSVLGGEAYRLAREEADRRLAEHLDKLR
jgi:5-methylthioadenosine/S-adenosylhomocysteine deaminase